MSEASENLINLVNEMQDKLFQLGVNDLALDLPQIAVIGGQSAGKSSVLESFVGRDFLPRGNNIVTRRPLVLQLINNKSDSKTYGEFLHIPDKQFTDFSQIRDEIQNETDREVKENDISSKPINLKIYSPDYLDLTLIDLPGMTKIAVGNQPKDIETRIENMVLEFIERSTCLILAVTPANQDLSTSDALKMAERVDPKGERTIGVLTKLDLMDKGTNARDILLNKHFPLKLGYIGIVNRSQNDIDNDIEMSKAMAAEEEYFKTNPAYKDIASKLGVSYLKRYLNKKLTSHILKILPPLQHRFKAELAQLNEDLDKVQQPIDETDKERILSESKEQLRQNYESSVGGKGVKLQTSKLSGGTKIYSIMNNRFSQDINQLYYDEYMMKKDITVAILNFYGAYPGVFTPDEAFRAIVKDRIEEFRKPALICVESVTQELENIIRESAANIKRFSNLKNLYTKLTLDFLLEQKKNCKSKVEHFVETEKTYLNTIHEDFIGFTSIGNSGPISNSQSGFVSSQMSDESKSKSDWISYNKTKYWFVLSGTNLTWYKNEKHKDKYDTVNLEGGKFGIDQDSENLTLVLNNKVNTLPSMVLTFSSGDVCDKWKEWLKESGVDSVSNAYGNDTDSVSDMFLHISHNGDQEVDELVSSEHMKGPINQVKHLVDSYIKIMRKKFKDFIPKICIIELVDTTRDFIVIDLKLRVRDSISSVEDLIKGDPEEEIRKNLTESIGSYTEVIGIIDRLTKYDSV